jgi:hypothetical protein
MSRFVNLKKRRRVVMTSIGQYIFFSRWPERIPHFCRAFQSSRHLPHVLLFLIFVSNTTAVPLCLSGQTPDILDAEHLAERLRQDVVMTAAQTDAILPMIADLCRSLQAIRSRIEQGETTAEVDAGKETEASISTFRDSVSVYLSPAQRVSLKEVLERWKHEFVADTAGKISSPYIERESAGMRREWSVTAPGFGNSPGSAAIDMARLETARTTPHDGIDIESPRGEWAIAPYPLVDPTVGNGAVFISAYIRPLNARDRVSPPSVSAAGARGKQINLPRESRLIFSLTAPVPMN